MSKRTAVVVLVVLFGALFASITSLALESESTQQVALASYETARRQEETTKIKARELAAPAVGVAMVIRENGGLDVLEKLPAINNSEEMEEKVEETGSPETENVEETKVAETEIPAETKEEVKAETEKPSKPEHEASEPENSGLPMDTYENPKYTGDILNSFIGTIEGPSGKETYYNLPMGGVIKNMKQRGFDYEYSVREDGVKLYGGYVMCAANLEERPFGTLVQTSLGLGIVCDTGGFAKYNRMQLDIAVDW